MKRFLSLVTVLVFLVGCGGDDSSDATTAVVKVEEETKVEPSIVQQEDNSTIDRKYYGRWSYVDSGEEIDILSTTKLDITEVPNDENLLKVNKNNTTYYLIRSSIAKTVVNGKIEVLTQDNEDKTSRSKRGFLGIGSINIILSNVLDSNINEQTTTESDGSFTTTTLPSGTYNLKATDSNNKLEAVVDITSNVNNIGSYKLTGENLNNFKAELIINENYILSDGNIHEAILRIHNISNNIGYGLSYDISLNTNEKVKSFTEGSVNASGSVQAKSYKDIPISFSFDKLSTNMKEYSINVVINDALGNKWADTFSFNVNKELVAILISTKSASIKGTIKNPLTGKITPIDTNDGKILVPLLPENKPYILVLSTSSFDSETFYSIGVNKKPEDFTNFKNTSAQEPNNNEAESTAIYTNKSTRSYIYGTDIDFWKIYTNEGVVIDKSLELFTNIEVPTAPTTAPSSVTATDGDYTDKIVVSWSNTSDATYFELYQATSSTGTYSKISSSIIGTSYTVTNVVGDITYYYKLKGCNDVGCSEYSNTNSGYIDVPNEPPVANAGANKTIDEGESVTLNGSASSDSDGKIVSYKWLENSTILSLNSSFSTTSLSGGIHELALVVTDDDGASDSDKVYVTVNATSNKAPRADAGVNQTVTEKESIKLDASNSTDSDGTIVDYVWKDGNTILSISKSFSKSDFSVGNHTITLTVTDDDGATDSDTVYVTVNVPLNKAPVITTTSFNVNENQTEVGTIQASDEDSINLIYSLSGTDASAFNIDSSTGKISFKNLPDYETKISYSITANVSDENTIVSKTITIYIVDVKEVPILENFDGSVVENSVAGTTVGIIEIIDISKASINSITLDGIGNENFEVSTNGVITVKDGANLDYETKKSYVLNAVATNSAGNSNKISISIDIIDTNDAPTISTTSFSVNENATDIGTIIANDQDNDTLTYSITGGSDSSKFNINSLTGILNFNFITNYESPSDSNLDNVYQLEITVADSNTQYSKLIDIKVEDLGVDIYSYRDIDTLYGVKKAISIDLDSDSDIDIVAIGTNEIYWYENKGNKNFTSHLVSKDIYSGNLQAIDYDNDGDIDIVSSGYILCWYENDGNENFRSHLIGDTHIGNNLVSDIDKDGDIDFLSVYTTAHTNKGLSLYWKEQKDTSYKAHLISEKSSDFASGSTYANAIDMDNDGDIDIIWSFNTTLSGSSNTRYYINWYENDGSNNFTNEHKIVETVKYLPVYFCDDINKDNYTEVIYPITATNRLGTNTYTNIYSNNTKFSNINGAMTIFDIADINSNQKNDIVVFGSTNKKLIIYSYDGVNSFIKSNIILEDYTTTETTKMSSAIVTDIDNDGKLDILSTYKTTNKISWHKNIGDIN